MEIELENCLKLSLNINNHTATITESPKVTGDLFIPRSIKHDGIEYLIISVGSLALASTQIDSLEFAEDSCVETFDSNSFCYSKIKKLQIPPKLTTINHYWANGTINLSYIEVSPKNKLFQFIDNQYLVGKSQNESDTFDVLIYACYNITEAIIPPQIKILRRFSFERREKLKSIKFTENSMLEYIENQAFERIPIVTLEIPARVKEIFSTNFKDIFYLTDIKISEKNRNFKLHENKFIITKSSKEKEEKDALDAVLFGKRDVEDIVIPSFIKIIASYSFQNCKKIKSFTFEENSLLEAIGCNFLSGTKFITSLVIPESVKKIGSEAFSYLDNLQSIVILGNDLVVGSHCFYYCANLSKISFPNATKISLGYRGIKWVSDRLVILVRPDSKRYGFDEFQNFIQFIDSAQNDDKIQEKDETKNQSDEIKKDETKSQNDETKNQNDETKSQSDETKSQSDETKSQSDETKSQNDETKSQSDETKSQSDETKSQSDETKSQIDENKDEVLINKSKIEYVIDYVRFLENKLSRYEDVTPFNFADIGTAKESEGVKNYEKREEKTLIFIGEEDEENQEVIKKIGEGATSVAYKVIDKKTSQVMCKKVLKYEEGQTTFKNIQNIIKEFEVLCRIDHPSICKAIGINMQEKYPADNSINDNEESPLTTIAIFIDFQPYKLKDCLEQKILNNTLKAKIAVEVCFGMSYIHRLGMIHRDLKIENIMLNCIFEAKIIDFDLVHVGINSVSQSLTKGIGTLAYMSPEMMNEEDYDYKTDVYSFGVVLYVMFVGHLPKQSMRDKLTNKPLSFPSPSQSISSYCISIIKKCLAFEPSERPTFDEILEDMKCHSFDLASEIQPEMVLKRYKELVWLKTQNY